MLSLLQSGGQLTIGFIFWFLMLCWFIFGVVWYRKHPPDTYIVAGGNIFLFILLFILGWATFGWPIAGK